MSGEAGSARKHPERAEGTARLEAFTDGVIAIVVTLLVLELHVPEVRPGESLLDALLHLTPQFASFTVSFVTVAIYWVNHHHFYTRVFYTDWRLLWLNNLFLFWLALVPFSTALVGDYTFEPIAVAVYDANLLLAALGFTLMGQYALFWGELADPTIPMAKRKGERQRAYFGIGLYLVAGALAFVWVPAALAIIAGIPVTYFVPSLVSGNDASALAS
jgi:uncharacterized membrane protein